MSRTEYVADVSGRLRAEGVDVELRVHGVHGTPPETMLEDPFPRQVAGDADARFYRADPERSPAPRRDRYVCEAFVWSRFTSGSPQRAFWLLFLPFALVNLSRYTILSWDDRWEAVRRSDGTYRLPLFGVDAALRLLGLAMTLSLLTTVVYASAELIAHRCILTVGCASADSHWLDFAESWGTGPALLLAIVPPAVVLGIVGFLGRKGAVLGGPTAPRWMPARRFADGDFWQEAAEVRALRAAHLAACCALLGLFYSGFHAGASGGAPAALLVQAVGGVVLLAAVVLTARPPTSDRQGRVLGFVGLGYAIVSCTWSIAAVWTSTAFTVAPGEASEASALPGLEAATAVLVCVSGLVLVYLFVLAGVFQCRFAHLDEGDGGRPASFSPLARGWAMPLLAAVGVGLMYGLTTGVAYRLADLVGTPGLGFDTDVPDEGEVVVPLSVSYGTGASITVVVAAAVALAAIPVAGHILQRRHVQWTYVVTLVTAGTAAALWAYAGHVAGLVAGCVALAFLVSTVVLLATPGPQLDGEIDQDYRPPPPSDPVRVPEALAPTDRERRRAVATAWRYGQAKYRYQHGLVLLGVVSAGGVLLATTVVIPRLLTFRDSPPELLKPVLSTLASPGAWVATSLLAGLLFVGVRSFRSATMRSATGIAWDLLSFWPRITHPLCPPPYGGRAVLELVDRATVIRQQPDSTVVLSAHSQGSVLCVAALATLIGSEEAAPAPELTRIGLVTYGSQLQWAYPRLFPCFIGYRHLVRVHSALGGRWRSLYRETDPLGGPVLTWHAGPRRPEEQPNRVREGCVGVDGSGSDPDRGTADVVRHGHDVRLIDPVRLERRRDGSFEVIRGHGDYYGVTAFDDVVDQVTDLVRRS